MKKRFWLAAALALLFLLLAAWVMGGRADPFEAWAYSAVIRAYSPFATAAARGISWLFNPPTVIAAALLLLAIPPTRKAAIPVFAAAGYASLLNLLLKRLFARERPSLFRLVEETGFSFPSGHAMASGTVGSALFFLVRRHIKRPGLRAGLSAACLALPLLVGVSRVYLGVHYAGDVLAGWVLGAAVGAAGSGLWELLQNKKD